MLGIGSTSRDSGQECGRKNSMDKEPSPANSVVPKATSPCGNDSDFGRVGPTDVVGESTTQSVVNEGAKDSPSSLHVGDEGKGQPPSPSKESKDSKTCGTMPSKLDVCGSSSAETTGSTGSDKSAPGSCQGPGKNSSGKVRVNMWTRFLCRCHPHL